MDTQKTVAIEIHASYQLLVEIYEKLKEAEKNALAKKIKRNRYITSFLSFILAGTTSFMVGYYDISIWWMIPIIMLNVLFLIIVGITLDGKTRGESLKQIWRGY